jgi:CheY-like chemotaxis protein
MARPAESGRSAGGGRADKLARVMAEPRAGILSVLVVEDEPDARDALAGFVRRLGGEVVVAATAPEGLAAVLAKLPHRVLLDLMLPGTGGLELLRLIRAHRLPVRVAITTAVHDPLAFGDLGALRPDAVFRKPLDLPAVRRWLLAP